MLVLMWGSASALTELVSWSAELPPWQRDALRRLVVAGRLTESCLNDLFSICCGKTGAPDPLPCDATHVASGGTVNRAISLRAIRNPQGVNALAEGQELTFQPMGLTVVYGENGAGKSGYARILKNACRAKDREEVLGDVRAGASTSSPTAEVEFVIDGTNRTITWQANVASDPDLSLISVFDSATASIRVDQANEAFYTPLPLRLLADLATACSALEARIKVEVTAVNARQPAWVKKPLCADGTSAMVKLKGLAPTTDVEALLGSLALTPDEQARRDRLAADLRSDPASLVKKLNRQVGGLERLLDIIRQAEDAASSTHLEALIAADHEAVTKRAVAEVAASKLFGTAPIQGIGGETWRHLWEAARRYSETAGYIGRRFPVVDDGSVCVLCVQPLGDAARTRLTSFEEFVCADTRTAADHAVASRDALFAKWRSLWPEASALPRIESFVADECGSAQLGASVRAYLCRVRWALRRFWITREAYPKAPDSPALGLRHIQDAFKAEVGRLQSGEAAAHLAAMRRELDELDGRLWLASMRDELLAEVARQAEYQMLERARATTNTRALSMKSRELSRVLVTDALRDAFAAEVAELGIPDLRVELVEDGIKRGEPQFRLRLVAGAQRPLSLVLSEGEFRMVALAAFLAELRVAGDICGIVFDDPVSSLDHRHRHAVARRLAREAAARQVVVFTHDLFFLFLLEEAAEEEAVASPHRQHVCRSALGEKQPGVVDGELPVVAQKPEHSIRMIQQKLRKAAAISASSPSEWEQQAKSLCNLIRLAWERALEGVIGVVLRRFSPTLHFHRIRELAVLDGADVAAARDGFDWCSRHMHNESLAGPRPVPTPEDIEHRLGQLLEWIQKVNAKQAAAKKGKA